MQASRRLSLPALPFKPVRLMTLFTIVGLASAVVPLQAPTLGHNPVWQQSLARLNLQK